MPRVGNTGKEREVQGLAVWLVLIWQMCFSLFMFSGSAARNQIKNLLGFTYFRLCRSVSGESFIFLFHQRAHLPSQCSDIINSNLDFLTTSFMFLVVTLTFKKMHRSSIGLEIRPQSAFTAFETLLLSANSSAE